MFITVTRCEELLQLQPFNGLFSRTTWVSRYQKGKTNLDFTGARDSESQWHQLGHMQVCTSLQTDNHASTPPLFFYRPDALPAAQPTASKHWRHCSIRVKYVEVTKKSKPAVGSERLNAVANLTQRIVQLWLQTAVSCLTAAKHAAYMCLMQK